MTNNEKATKIFESLQNGFEVVAKRPGGNVAMMLTGIVDGKCVAVVKNDDETIKLVNVSNDEIVRVKSETICEASTVSIATNDAETTSAPSVFE